MFICLWLVCMLPLTIHHKNRRICFYDDLCCTINYVCKDDLLIVLGDFNARVGTATSEPEKSQRNRVRGFHGVGKINEAGTSLLTFCALNGLSVMNT